MSGQKLAIMHCLENRRSIRKFLPQPVAREKIEALLSCAILAPSASNRQPWRFIVIDEPELLRKIKVLSPGIGGQPPCLIFLCVDTRLLPQREGCPDCSTAVLDLAMAAENLMLAALEYGLGTCVIKSFHPTLVSRLLKLPEQIVPELLVTLGYPEVVPPMPKRKPLESLLCYNGGKED